MPALKVVAGGRSDESRAIERREDLDTLLDSGVEAAQVDPELLAEIVAGFFGSRQPPLAGPPDTGSVTRFGRFLDTTRLLSYNDTSAIGERPRLVTDALAAGHAVIALIRHGQTAGNVAGRWQGSTDEELNETGERQARELAAWYGAIESVWTSPLVRAARTASALHPLPQLHPALVEFNFGSWEGMTTDEIRALHGEDFDRIFVDGSDHPRGGTGETWSQAEERMRRAIEELDPKGGEVTGVVSHGAAIRALLTSYTVERWVGAFRVAIQPNTSVTHLILGPDPVVADYGVAPHLGH